MGVDRAMVIHVMDVTKRYTLARYAAPTINGVSPLTQASEATSITIGVEQTMQPARASAVILRRLGVPVDPSRPATVRSAQRALGLEPCFGTDERYDCRHADCFWRAQCLRLKADWLR